MSTLTFGFIGLGLIGGSIARAIRQNLPQSQIIAYDINADTLREAAQCGVANVITTRMMLPSPTAIIFSSVLRYRKMTRTSQL